MTILFILVTFSIGLVSINLPLSVKAQNSALSQDGDGDAEQRTERGQASNQNNLVVSGSNNIATGNNLICETEVNSYLLTGSNDFCKSSEPNSPPPSQGDTPRIIIRVHASISSFGTTSLENYGKLTFVTGQQHYVEYLNHSASDHLSKEYVFNYNAEPSGGKLMMELKPTLGPLKLVYFVITKNDFEVTANCSPYSIRNPSTTCTIVDPNPQVPTRFDISFTYFPEP